MPNYCDYVMRIAGYKNNVDEMVRILQNDYDKIHLYRIFDVQVCAVEDYGVYRKVHIAGYCAWSVYSCMMPGFGTYYDGTKRPENYPAHITKTYYGPCEIGRNATYFPDEATRLGTHIIHEAARLNLIIEIHSTEPGMCFCEDIKILPGGIIARDNCGDYYSTFIEDCDTYEDLKKEYESYPSDLEHCSEEDFYNAKHRGDSYVEYMEYEDVDTISMPPKYLSKNLMYRLVNVDVTEKK